MKYFMSVLTAILFIGITAINPITVCASSDYETIKAQIEEHRQNITLDIAKTKHEIERAKEKIAEEKSETEKNAISHAKRYSDNTKKIKARSKSLNWIGNIFRLNPIIILLFMLILTITTLIFRSIIQYTIRKILIDQNKKSKS